MQMQGTMKDSGQNRFGLFPYLHEDVKMSVISYLAEAPFESMPANYLSSPLTHELPYVSMKFRTLCDSDFHWKNALERNLKREPLLWRTGLVRICSERGALDDEFNELKDKEDLCLLECAHRSLGKPTYKSLYQNIVTVHIRFKGPCFVGGGQIQLGLPYSIRLSEPRYKRFLIEEVMRGHSESAKHGGRITKEAIFCHANRFPLVPTTPAALVHVTRCEILEDGDVDVVLVPFAFAWLERLWIRPSSNDLIYVQCLKMGRQVTSDMGRLARQEALATFMERIANDLQSSETEEFDRDEVLDADDLVDDSDEEIVDMADET